MQSQDPPTTPEELLEQVGLGCDSSLSELHKRYRKILHYIATCILKDHFGADDVIQDTFVSVWNNARGFDPAEGSATAWMIRITRNHALDGLRKNKTRQRYMDVVGESALACGLQPEPSAALVASEQAGSVRLMLNALPRAPRLVLVLSYYEGLSQTEIADRLDEPLGTVKSRLRTAIRLMRGMVGVPRI